MKTMSSRAWWKPRKADTFDASKIKIHIFRTWTSNNIVEIFSSISEFNHAEFMMILTEHVISDEMA